MSDNPTISVIVPVLNEEHSLKKFYTETLNSLREYSTWEIIFIDDGSDDNSYNIIRELVKNDNRITVIKFYKNFGKAEALSEGFNQATGDIIITIDADLQDDPAEIPQLIAKIQEGWDLVSGWKKERKDPVSKRIPSIIFNYVTRILTGINIHDFNCGLKAYHRRVIKAVDIYGGLHRYIPALAGQKGFSITEIEVNHRSREFGETKYGGNRFFHGFFDLFTMLFTSKYFNRPLHFFGFIGLILIISGIIINVYLTIGWLYGIWIGNRPIFFLGILFIIIGIQFFSIGLLGELFIKTSGKSEKKIHSVYSRHQD